MNPNVMLKWGIVTAGKSSRNFAIAIKNLPKSKHELLAIVSQDKVRVNLFADEFDIQIRYTKYEDLANDQNVDVVYIGSLHPQHFETAKLMLLHRKHVVCEKPLCSNAMLTQSLITVAQNQNKFLMECMYCRCLPIYDEIKKIIQENLLGYTLYAYTCLGRKLNHLDRLLFPELGGSAILDLGVQCLQFLQFVFEEIHPHTIKAIGHFNHWRSDESVSAVLNYPGGKSGIITVHTCAKFPNEALVIGTDGCIKIPSFNCPSTISSSNVLTDLNLNIPSESVNKPSTGMAFLADEVRSCLIAGKIESPKMSHDHSLLLAEYIDKIKTDLGMDPTKVLIV